MARGADREPRRRAFERSFDPFRTILNSATRVIALGPPWRRCVPPRSAAASWHRSRAGQQGELYRPDHCVVLVGDDEQMVRVHDRSPRRLLNVACDRPVPAGRQPVVAQQRGDLAHVCSCHPPDRVRRVPGRQLVDDLSVDDRSVDGDVAPLAWPWPAPARCSRGTGADQAGVPVPVRRSPAAVRLRSASCSTTSATVPGRGHPAGRRRGTPRGTPCRAVRASC